MKSQWFINMHITVILFFPHWKDMHFSSKEIMNGWKNPCEHYSGFLIILNFTQSLLHLIGFLVHLNFSQRQITNVQFLLSQLVCVCVCVYEREREREREREIPLPLVPPAAGTPRVYPALCSWPASSGFFWSVCPCQSKSVNVWSEFLFVTPPFLRSLLSNWKILDSTTIILVLAKNFYKFSHFCWFLYTINN